MSTRMILAAAAASLAMLAPAAAQAQQVADKPVITLDPEQSYMIVQTSSAASGYGFVMSFLRRPEQADIDDYLKRRAEALNKAHQKWVRKHADWVDGRKSGTTGADVKEPVEPTDANLAFAPIEKENIFQVGPFDRFAKNKDEGRSTFIVAVKPGRYVFYGPVFVAVGQGECMCMGSIEFEVKPKQIVYAGVMQFNWFAERDKAKREHRPPPKDNGLDFPETMNSISWLPPQPGYRVDPRLSAYTIVPAELHAYGRIPNYFGAAIDRLTALDGVLAYDRDKVIDVKTGEVKK
jgi:hypothetical protein